MNTYTTKPSALASPLLRHHDLVAWRTEEIQRLPSLFQEILIRYGDSCERRKPNTNKETHVLFALEVMQGTTGKGTGG